MSYPSFELVREFFTVMGFFTLEIDEVLFVNNQKPSKGEIEFVIAGKEVPKIKSALVKVISWHTQNFTPSVLRKFPEIFLFPEVDFVDKDARKILVIPSLPKTERLKKESVKMMKEKGIGNVLFFNTVISSLIEKINSRKVYLSFTKEILRILKYYGFFSEIRELPFYKK